MATVAAGLQHHAPSWAGRTVLIRGLIEPRSPYSWCAPSSTQTSTCRHSVYLIADHPSIIQSRTYTQGRATRTVLSYSTAVLQVELPLGGRAPAAAPQLPSMLYAIPLVGALLTDRFPRNGDIVVPVRLATTHLCATQATQAPALDRCSDGVFLPRR